MVRVSSRLLAWPLLAARQRILARAKVDRTPVASTSQPIAATMADTVSTTNTLDTSGISLRQPMEATVSLILNALRREKSRLQRYHGVFFSDTALRVLANGVYGRYADELAINKAIDLLDHLGARQKVIEQLGTKKLGCLQDSRESLHLHIRSLQDDTRAFRADPKKIERLESEILSLEREVAALEQEIELENTNSKKLRFKIAFARLLLEADDAEKNGLLARASEIRHAVLPFLQHKLTALGVKEDFSAVIEDCDAAEPLVETLGGKVEEYMTIPPQLE